MEGERVVVKSAAELAADKERAELLAELDALGGADSVESTAQSASDDALLEPQSDAPPKRRGRPPGSGTGQPRARRTSLSDSPLANPNTAIHLLAQQVQNYLYFPEPDPLYVVLGTLAGNMMKGNPIWMMLVGSPSSGRTLVLETLEHIEGIHIIGAIKSPSSLISGVSKKDVVKGATGGILRSIGDHGMMVMKDFTSMLSMPREAMAESIGALREIYDGRYSRPLGADGGRVLEWTGKVGFIGACTPELDRHSKAIGDLGERWVYYRYVSDDGEDYGKTMKALANRNPKAMMEELRSRVGSFIGTLNAEWNSQGGMDSRELTQREASKVYALAAIVTSVRSGAPRDWGTREINGFAVKEGSARVGTVLGQLYLGLEAIGLAEGERWRIVQKVAMDSAPQLRMAVVLAIRASKTLEGYQAPITQKAIRSYMGGGIGKLTVKETIQVLVLHNVVQRYNAKEARMDVGEDEDGVNAGYGLTDWAEGLFLKAGIR